MEKEWFIQLSGYHKGPFSQDQIMELWQGGKLSPRDMLWRRGMGHWQRFDQVEGLGELFPPVDIPQAKRPEQHSDWRGTAAMPAQEKGVVEFAPSPVSAELPLEPAGKEKKGQSWHLVVMACLAVVGVGLWQMASDLPRPLGLELKEFMQLKRVLEISPRQQIGFRFAFDHRVNRLWVACNLGREVMISVKLEALAGKVLSLSPVEFSGQSKLRRHFAQIDRFVFKQGSQIHPGFYKMYLSYAHRGRDQSFSNVIYLGPGSKQQFAQTLETYQQKMTQLFAKYSSDLLQRYTTLSSLLVETRALLEQHLLSLARGEKVLHFKRDYDLRVAPLLGQLTTAPIRPGAVLVELNQLKKHFISLSELAKALSTLAGKMLQSMPQKERLPQREYRQLRALFMAKLQALQNNIRLGERQVHSSKLFKF